MVREPHRRPIAHKQGLESADRAELWRPMTRKEFNRARLAFLDQLRRDSTLTPAARLVGWEIGSRVNMVSGAAWPAQETIASALGLDSRTVRRSIRELTRCYYTIHRGGRSLSYMPNFDGGKPDKLSGVDQSETQDKNVPHRTQKQPATGGQNVHQSPSRDPLRTSSITGIGDVTVTTTSVATDLFNQLLAILGIDLSGQRNDADQRARRREDILWVGEQVALFEPIFADRPHTDAQHFILSVARQVRQRLRPNTQLRTVRYLQPALARHYQELVALTEQVR
jgi:hypothetical protein